MSIESSNDTPSFLSANTRRAAFLVHPTSAPISYRDFVAFFPGSDRFVIRVASESGAFGQVVSARLTQPGSSCPVEVVYLYGGGSSGGTGGPSVASGAMVGTNLVLTNSDASTVTIDLSSTFDNDNLARVTSAALAGTVVTFTRDDSSTFDVDLASLGGGNPVTAANVIGTDLILTLADSSTVTADVSGLFDDTNLPRIISAAVSGTDIEFTRDDSSTFTVDLSSFIDDTNLARITAAALVGSELVLTRDDATELRVEMNDIPALQNIITSVTLNGTDLDFDQVGGGTLTVDLASLLDDTNLARVTSGAVVGSNLVLTRDDSSTVNIDISGIVPRPSYRGQLDAAVDTLPSAGVLVGDYYYINNAGTNLGNIEEVDQLSNGDMVEYLDLTGDGDPTNPQNWIGRQRNINDEFAGFTSLEDIPQTVNLAANTPLTVNSVVLATGAVRHVTLLDSTGKVITSGVDIVISGNQATLESNVPLTGVVVHMSGVA